ncbi:unnamed protein product [Bursaphelenchus okinawaensis]|uniref:alcohol dehydrogenase n=1 Tax=Bursaphelenchus okinawaensis TaxID=465554 RepID=A0A811KAG8_9BILA|nr:unnamed protein product [Bursaphelenchus okinawaensis]CAG9099102.1 unnamed protein product [Bursaphelenchus okinawaensis]
MIKIFHPVMTSIPKTQKAAVYDDYSAPIVIKDTPVPEPSHDDVLVKILYSGVCYSDVSIHGGLLPGQKFPCVGGHEGVGVVVKVGDHVQDVKVGEKVGVKWVNGTCLNCEYCRAGREPNCCRPIYTGYSREGTYQQFTLIKENHAIKLPDSVNLAEAAPILCAGVTVYKALKDSGLRAGQTLAVTGAGGGLGTLAIQYAKAMGLKVLAVDAGAKEQVCKDVGADYFVDPFSTKDIVATIQELTKGGPNGVLNLANSGPAINKSIEYVRTGGTVIIVALPKNAKLDADIVSTVLRNITIRTSYVGTRQDTDEALDFLARGKVKVPIEIRPFSRLVESLEQVGKGQVQGRIVIDLWQ